MERRRETRISGSSAQFVLDSSAGLVSCVVTNLSRLGLGIVLPDVALGPFFDNVISGSFISGSLVIGRETLRVDVVVRMKKGNFLGLEYVANSGDFVSALRTILSPAYIGSSIYSIAQEHLGPDIKAAYRGDDFECIMFKNGAAGGAEMIQIFTEGFVVEIANGRARFVPPPMVRIATRRGNVDFLNKMAQMTDEGNSGELKEFFLKLSKIVDSWADCPPEFNLLVQSQLQIL